VNAKGKGFVISKMFWKFAPLFIYVYKEEFLSIPQQYSPNGYKAAV
jgi:hypothetical protein